MCLNEQGVWQLHGVLSREGECHTRPHPDVFASISLSKTWIENVIGFQQSWQSGLAESKFETQNIVN